MGDDGTFFSDGNVDGDVETIFAAAAEMASGAERAAYLDRVGARAPALRARVERLLEAQARAGDFMRDEVGSATVDPPAPVPEAEKPGTRIGPYKLLQVIGEGGMGSVYMAEQTWPVERRVALKIIKPGMDSGEVVARFEAERQALALMDHPCIAKVFDAGATKSGRPYFVMELVKGIPITEYCDERELGARRRLELFVRVCRAVHHAHQKGVIHRDIKPANVLVADYDDKAVPKVIDFGIAKAFGQKLTDKTMFTQYGQIVGTFEYMSPEQAKFNQLDVDTRCDIYSLGVLLYELLTGTTPFERGRLQVVGFEEILRIIREEEPPKPSTRISTLGERTMSVTASRGSNPGQLRRDLRGELDWIVMRAMDKERDRRYESAAALADDIERFLGDEPVEACPPSTAYRVRKFVRRNRGPVVAASAVFAVLLLGLVGTILGLLRATAAEGRAENERDAQQRLNFRMAVDRGLALCEDGHVGHGMLWLVRALELAPPEEEAMVRLVRMNLNAWRSELHKLEELFEHDGPVTSVALSPRGDRLAIGCYNGAAHLWDIETGEHKARLKLRGDVHEVAFSPDGTRLVTADAHTTTASLWDPATGDLIRRFNHGEDKPPREIAEQVASGGVLSAAFRPPSNAQVVTGCGDGTVIVWDTSSGRRVVELEQHEHVVHDVVVSPDGQLILTSSHGNLAQLWDFEGKRLATFRHEVRVGSAAFLDGGRVVTGDGNGNVCVWSVARAMADDDKTLETSKEEYLVGPWVHRGIVHRLRVSPDGKRVLVGSFDNTARLWDPDRNRQIGPAFEHEAQVQSVAWASDGRLIATGCDDNSARLWRPAPGQSVRVIRHESFDHEAVYTKDGRYVLIKNEAQVTVRDAITGEPLCSVRYDGGIRAMAVSPDRSRLLIGCVDSMSRLYDTATGELLSRPMHHGGAGVWAVDISDDNTRMLTTAFSGAIALHDPRSGETLREWTIAGRVQGVAFTPDGTRFVVTSNDKMGHIFETDSEAPSASIDLVGHRGTVASVSFSADGRRVATGGMDNTARAWDAVRGKPLGEPMRLRSPILIGVSTAMSPDGRMVATASSDGTVQVWDVATSRAVGPALVQKGGSGLVAFTRDGNIVAGSLEATVHVWDAARAPLGGDVTRIRLWVEVITGFELDAGGKRRALDGKVWKGRRARLRALGGAPTKRE